MSSNLDKKKEKNRKQRIEFVKQWAEYVKNHPDEEWSEQQNLIINSQLETARQEIES